MSSQFQLPKQLVALCLVGATWTVISKQVAADPSEVLKASLDQDGRQLQESCRKVETDGAVARFTAEHAHEDDFRDQLESMVMSCSFPLSLAWTMAEKGISPDKTKNKVERTCLALAPKPTNLAASFLTWSATQPAEFLDLEGLTGALMWASTYFKCKPA